MASPHDVMVGFSHERYSPVSEFTGSMFKPTERDFCHLFFVNEKRCVQFHYEWGLMGFSITKQFIQFIQSWDYAADGSVLPRTAVQGRANSAPAGLINRGMMESEVKDI